MKSGWGFGTLTVVALLLCGCGSQSQSATAPFPTPVAPAKRQVALPVVTPNSSCPVSGVQNFPNPPGNKLPGYGYGPGPVFLSGQLTWFNDVYALILVPPGVSGDVLVRGHQLDGPGGIPFEGQQGNGNIKISGQDGTWRSWGGQMSGGPGCYGLQVDGNNFSELIVFSISPGPAPPA
jgi:hypothetical protein